MTARVPPDYRLVFSVIAAPPPLPLSTYFSNESSLGLLQKQHGFSAHLTTGQTEDDEPKHLIQHPYVESNLERSLKPFRFNTTILAKECTKPGGREQ